jgi:hypothetical protein
MDMKLAKTGGIMKATACCLFLLFFMIQPAFAVEADEIGYIHTLKGSASILRGNLTLPAVVSVIVHKGDLVRTSKDSSIGIVLFDDTILSLGPNSELVIKDYAFDPKEGRFAFLARMVKGTFSYFSGLIGKLAPDSVRLEIPDATIAVRGTKLLVEVKE